MDRHSHWQNVYATKDHTRVSWYQTACQQAIEDIKQLKLATNASILDVGAGASKLIDELVAAGFQNLSALDIAELGLKIAKDRLGEDSNKIQWLCADITTATLPQKYDLWHDRAAFHFLTETADREAYIRQLRTHLNPNAWVMLATFAIDGPQRCSDLLVEQYDEEKMMRTLGEDFCLVKSQQATHTTPGGSEQLFQHCLIRYSGTNT